MIIGLGTDILSIQRINHIFQNHGQRFLQRVFHSSEMAYALSLSDPAFALANRFAAKEAAFKALGTGKRHPFSWKDVYVVNSPQGQPLLQWAPVVEQFLKNSFGPGSYHGHCSLSHTDDMALAMVVLERLP